MNQHPELGVVPPISSTLKTLSNGTMRLSIDVDPDYRDSALYWFGQPGLTLAVARLVLEPLVATPATTTAAATAAATTTAKPTPTLPPAPEAQR